MSKNIIVLVLVEIRLRQLSRPRRPRSLSTRLDQVGPRARLRYSGRRHGLCIRLGLLGRSPDYRSLHLLVWTRGPRPTTLTMEPLLLAGCRDGEAPALKVGRQTGRTGLVRRALGMGVDVEVRMPLDER